MWHLKEIPKVAHFFWDGEKLSYLRYLTLVSFRRLNPDWKIVLYTSIVPHKKFYWKSGEQNYGNNYVNYLNRVNDLDIAIEEVNFDRIGFSNSASSVHKSDYLRLKLLSEVGGLWSDMDILYIKPMDEISFNKPSMSGVNTVFCNGSYGHSIGFLMSGANNECFESLSKASLSEYKKEGYQCMGSLLYSKLFPTVASVKGTGIVSYNLPMDTVYAYDFTKVNEIFKPCPRNRLTPNSIGIHWYAGHQIAGEYLNTTNGGLYSTDKTLINLHMRTFRENKPMPIEPKISIVMSVYNRQGLLDRTLESIRQSKVKNYELIIVDDCSDKPVVCKGAKIIRIEKEDKWYNCPAVPFNIGLREATGDIVIIQNPECYHVGDVLSYVLENIRPGKYISFACYSLNKSDTDILHGGAMPEMVNVLADGRNRSGWYNHSEHRPMGYHFCAAIMRDDMDKVGGFDERYAYGFSYDDDDFVRTIRYMGIDMEIVNEPFVMHQYHGKYFISNPRYKELHELNRKIFNQGFDASIHRDYGRDKDDFDPDEFLRKIARVELKKKDSQKKDSRQVLGYFLKSLGGK
jgi:glycosyltransferase involved in cell wall biosynthesis